MKKQWVRIISAWMLLIVSLAPLVGAARAQVFSGTIAYVEGSTRDEIRLIEPDGSNDRPLWASSVPDPENGYEIWSLAWRSNSAQLAFASTHESWCSINASDIFTIDADGTDYRRVTEAPACAALASYPQGEVRLPVSNSGGSSFTGFVYFQGASSAQMVNLPPGGSTEVVFSQVADFGPGELQTAGFSQGSQREINVGAAVDVQAGASVTSDGLSVFETSSFSIWEVHSPTWHYDGSQIGYLLNLDSLRKISPTPQPLDFGELLLAADQSSLPDFVRSLAYGPTETTANQLLYIGSTAFDSQSVYRVTEGSATPGTPLVTFDFTETILGLAWLPDGSGFVFSVKEIAFEPEYTESANIYHYDFDSEAVTPVTEFSGEFTGMLSVSPDGQQIVFERGAELDVDSFDVIDPNLWLVNLDGSGLSLLIEDGRAPAWSPGELAPPPQSSPQYFLPLLLREQG